MLPSWQDGVSLSGWPSGPADRRHLSLDSMTKLKEPQSQLPVRTELLRLAPIH
jgi:hypothetical protein